MEYPVVDDDGELVYELSGTSVTAMLASCGHGQHLLVAPLPGCPSWWSFSTMEWIPKPVAPSSQHVWDSTGKQWIDPYTPEQRRQLAMDDLRKLRDQELARSDLVALRSIESLLPPAVRAWRQALRDLPETVADPLAPVELPSEPPGY